MIPPRSALARLFLWCVVSAACLFVTRDARADDEKARVFFKKGIELYDRKQYEPALESFRAAYAEKPSPGIKQNIALSLKGLGRNVEAATAFDEALDEGRDTLKPETKAAMERELAELAKVVGTITIKLLAMPEKTPVEGAALTVDGQPVPPAAIRRPIRLEPGIHVFRAKAKGYSDPPEKKLSILAGQPVDATFELTAPGGLLVVKPNVPTAVVRVDGTAYPPGPFNQRVTDGPHRVEISAPGYQTMTFDAVVTNGATVEYPIGLLPGSEPPIGEYTMPVRKPPPKPKRFYVVPQVAGATESLRFAPALREPVGGERRSVGGFAVGARAGLRLGRFFSLEILGEGGTQSAKYNVAPESGARSMSITHWMFLPALRFSTEGTVHFTMATGLGVSGRSVECELPAIRTTSTTTTLAAETKTGSGVGVGWLLDLGVQFDLGASLFLEAVGFIDMHGIGPVRDDASGERLFFASPATRIGARVGLGIQF
ncbi:MAG: PEGA domain-containing protein [Deltaproteobacteria bacterium]|nr:PEGA domain-containing protein [Deltaproteobacteria bacterium]